MTVIGLSSVPYNAVVTTPPPPVPNNKLYLNMRSHDKISGLRGVVVILIGV